MTAPAPARPSAPEAPAMPAAPAPAMPAAAPRAGRAVRYYPTDLLLAMEEADRPGSGLDELLDAHRLAALRPLFGAGEEFADGLDELLGGLAQYPWQPLTDTNDVDELRPVGAVVLDDDRPGTTLRGLLLAWATGNHVTVRTADPGFWQALTALLHRPGLPLPTARAVPRDAPAAAHGTPLCVPDLLPLTARAADGAPHDAPAGDGAPHDAPAGDAARHDAPARTPARYAAPAGDAAPSGSPGWDPALYATPGSAGPEPLVTRFPAGRELPAQDAFTAGVLRSDCRAAWTAGLSRRTRLHGTTLAAARAAEDPRRTGRLDARLRHTLARARRSPYYRDMPPVRTLDDLPGLPVLDKAALAAHSLPAGRGFASGARPTGEVLRSGSTTGTPRYIVYARTDWDNMVREAVPLFYAMGLEPGDRLVNTLFGGDLYGGLTTTVTEFSRMPLECCTTAQAATPESLLMLARSFGANAVIGVPTMIVPLLREAYRQDPLLRIEKVLYLGTAMGRADRTWLREHLGTRIVSSVLAANDGAQLGYQCAALDGMLHHVNDDYNYLEVVDDHGRPLPDGTAGELLTTTFQKGEGPLIRYRIGDRGRFVHHDCPCGISGRTLEYHGRSDGVVRLMGAALLHAELLDAVSGFGVSELQAEITSQGGRDTLTVRTESPRPLRPEELRAHLADRFPLLAGSRVYEDGAAPAGPADFRVECHAPGALARNPASGKIRPVVDRRVEA
ncbi:phenylacetate--CoA ligase family protein [Streptomyces sp. NRRL F-2747]|uniref:phenylacetate--CoA ligase family protein n=1 Tax=Streptomyces sp. NRRL F-2747 TaxID=1463843 RepID=UPI0018FEE8A9|nr:phenylacetate--CoA ligase family protein [Streptomyces sp. NRRL F-2747]